MTCLALAGKWADLRQQRIAAAADAVLRLRHQIAQRQRPEAHAAAMQHLAPSEGKMVEWKWVRHASAPC